MPSSEPTSKWNVPDPVHADLLRPHPGEMPADPLRSPVELTSGMVVQARVRTTPARPAGTWTSWAIALPGAGWEKHDEQAVWEEIDD